MKKNRSFLSLMFACSLVVSLPLAACDDDESPGGGGTGQNSSGQNGTGGVGGGSTSDGGSNSGLGGTGQTGTGGTGGSDGGSNSGTGDGEEGIFATLNGVPLKANNANKWGEFLHKKSLDDSGGFSHAIAEAYEAAGETTVTWSIWIPRAEGIYGCGKATDGALTGSIAIGEGPNGRSGANSGISATDCSFEVTHFDAAGIISGTFSGTLGGFLGAPQEVTKGSFYFDNTPTGD